MDETKPMKPVRAWAVICANGKLSTVENVACLFPARKDAERWAVKTERPIRVRILDDAAVERAIAVLRAAEANLGTAYPFTSDIHAAIRDLGGRP